MDPPPISEFGLQLFIPILTLWEGGGGLARGQGVGLFAFGGAYWPLALAHSDPLWDRTCFGVSTEPLDELSCLTTLGSPVPETGSSSSPCR